MSSRLITYESIPGLSGFDCKIFHWSAGQIIKIQITIVAFRIFLITFSKPREMNFKCLFRNP